MRLFLGAFLAVACAHAAGGVAPERMLKGTDTLGHRGDALLYSVSGISVDGHGNTYVTDILEYALKKFDPRGRIVARAGRRGTAPGEFRAPSLSAAGGGCVVVIQIEDPRIEIFDSALGFREEIRVSGGLPVDLARAGDAAFAVALCGDSARADVLFFRPAHAGPVARLRLAPTGSTLPLYAAVRIAILPGGSLVAAYLFLNRVEIYSRAGILLRRFSLALMPAGTVPPGDRHVPEETFFRKVMADGNGNIFLLGGNQSPHPGRDLFVCSPAGTLLRTLVLPVKPRTVALAPGARLLATDESGTDVIAYNLR